MAYSERARQWVHVGSASFAFLLRVLTWWQAAAMAAFALLFNLLVLPRIGGRRLYRPADSERGFPLGIVLYPLSVLLLILVFSSRLDLAAAAWGVLAFGDGAATLAGRRIGGRRWTWNPEKTIAGSAAFVLFGGLGAIVLAWWTSAGTAPSPGIGFLIIAPTVAAVAAAAIETVPIGLDDNVSVPFAAAGVLALASLMTPDAVRGAAPLVARALPWAIAVNAVVAWLGHRAKTVSLSGAITGALLGTIIYAAGGAGAWILLFVTFVVASATSRLGLRRKVLLGIAEARGGRRGAGNALANCGVAVLAAVAMATTAHASSAALALVAALAAGGSDTVASEVGKAWGRRTFLVTSMRGVPPGTPGAMSLEGTAAGIVSALGLAGVGAAFGLIAPGTIPTVAVAATAGALVESLLGATLEGPGILNNDMLNFINTAVAAALALVLV